MEWTKATGKASHYWLMTCCCISRPLQTHIHELELGLRQRLGFEFDLKLGILRAKFKVKSRVGFRARVGLGLG